MLAIYTRLSKDDTKKHLKAKDKRKLIDNSTSITNQLREGKEFAKKNNLKYSIYNEGSGVSGTLDIENRPKLLELINDIKKGKVKSVWMRNQNRLDRNTGIFYLFVTAVKKAEIQVYFADGDAIDFNDPTTLLQTSIISSLNQYQAQLQSKQTKKALKDSASEGKAWGVIPYGYSADKKSQIIINEIQAEIVKKIFELSLKDWGTLRIATYLNDEGIPTRYNDLEGTLKTTNRISKREVEKNYKDIKWSPNTVLGILKNTWYIGSRIYAGIEYPTPSIIDKAIFDKVQNNLVKNKSKGGRKATYNYLLKGIAICGKCGRNYYGRFKPPKNGKTYNDENYYTCSSKRSKHTNCGNRSISIPFIEGLIWERFFKYRELNELIDKHFEETNVIDILSDLEQRLHKLNERLSKFDEERQMVRKMRRKGQITEKEFEHLKSVNDEENQVKSEAVNIKEQIISYKDSIALKEQQSELKGIHSDISFLDKKKLVNKYIKEVLINHNDNERYYEITIKFKIEIQPEKYIVTTFKKEIFRVVEGFGIFTHKINMDDLKGRYFHYEQTTVPILNNPPLK